jgi:hypothetical protein
VNLEEELQNLAVAEFGGIKDDLDRFGMRAMIAVGRIAQVAPRVADPSRYDAVMAPKKILHAPKATARKNRTFCGHWKSST